VELVVRLKFTTPCLGNVRRSDYDRMTRDDEGRVIFMPTWWRSAFVQAARAISRYYDYVNKILPALPIDGELTRITRRYGRGLDDIKVHEGYDVGAIITVKFAIPGKMHIRQFVELLESVGMYVGISPYRGGKNYGFFKVLEVRKVGTNNHKKGGRCNTGNAANDGDSSSDT
jgi:hypothetical protein